MDLIYIGKYIHGEEDPKDTKDPKGITDPQGSQDTKEPKDPYKDSETRGTPRDSGSPEANT